MSLLLQANAMADRVASSLCMKYGLRCMHACK